MTDIPKRKNQPALIELLIWAVLGVLMFLYLPLTWNVQLPYQFWINQSFILFMLIAIYYFNVMFLVPKLLFQNKTAWFVLSLFGVSVVFMLAMEYSEHLLHFRDLMEQVFKNHRRMLPPRNEKLFNPFHLTLAMLVLGISTSVASTKKWQKDNQVRVLLEQEKASSELAFLRSQINPHFFFNTLNNIYALMHVDIESSKIALHKLSRMMRYLLYETQNEHTLLSKEVSFVSDFIELMKLRLSNTEVEYTPAMVERDLTVSPMLFLPFVENAFKHGINPAERSRIFVDIRLEGSQVELIVENEFFIKPESTLPATEKGIGLTNTKRRLDLLYPGKHNLSVQKDFNQRLYKVVLKIDFS